jgi:acyl-CoA thioesterase FadM
MFGPPGNLRTIAASMLGRDRGIARRRTDWVRPHQIDLNGHMNQAAYLQVAELARVEWLLGTRVFVRWRKQGGYAFVASQEIVYRRELAPLQRYVTDTRHVGMEGRLAVFETHFLVGDRVHAKNTAKLILMGPGGVLSAEESARWCEGLAAPALPVDAWRVVG